LDNNDDDASANCFSVFDPEFSTTIPVWETCYPNTVSSGTQATIVDTPSHGQQKLYSMASPEVWFEDFGRGELVGGIAIVTVDPAFAETANLGDYHLFLTPLDDCNGLYVAAKTATSFEVRELNGGNASLSFDYRIVAKRLGYEDVRLKEAQE
jgi:hypothetical protein